MSILDQLRGYLRVYLAVITQAGATAPVAAVVLNTLGNIRWEYASPGTYELRSDGQFTANQSAVVLGLGIFEASFAWAGWQWFDETDIEFQVGPVAGPAADNIFAATTVLVVVSQ